MCFQAISVCLLRSYSLSLSVFPLRPLIPQTKNLFSQLCLLYLRLREKDRVHHQIPHSPSSSFPLILSKKTIFFPRMHIFSLVIDPFLSLLRDYGWETREDFIRIHTEHFLMRNFMEDTRYHKNHWFENMFDISNLLILLPKEPPPLLLLHLVSSFIDKCTQEKQSLILLLALWFIQVMQ